jgi:hypothetical protein
MDHLIEFLVRVLAALFPRLINREVNETYARRTIVGLVVFFALGTAIIMFGDEFIEWLRTTDRPDWPVAAYGIAVLFILPFVTYRAAKAAPIKPGTDRQRVVLEGLLQLLVSFVKMAAFARNAARVELLAYLLTRDERRRKLVLHAASQRAVPPTLMRAKEFDYPKEDLGQDLKKYKPDEISGVAVAALISRKEIAIGNVFDPEQLRTHWYFSTRDDKFDPSSFRSLVVVPVPSETARGRDRFRDISCVLCIDSTNEAVVVPDNLDEIRFWAQAIAHVVDLT